MEQELNKKKKDELVRLCKERNLSHSGTKPVLVRRLLEAGGVPEKSTSPPPCQKLIPKRYIHARKNAHGNFEDPITHFVFDPATRAVIGKQQGEQVEPISLDDIAYCRTNGLLFEQTRFTGHSQTTEIETTIETLLATQQEQEDESDEEEEL